LDSPRKPADYLPEILSTQISMKVLVTGAAGFLGLAVVARLLAHGYTDIRCNIRRRSQISKLEALAKQYPGANLEFCIANLRYPQDATRAADGVQLVFHLAAGLQGAPADLFLDSVAASRNLLDAIGDRQHIRIVLVSSFAVYGLSTLRRGSLLNEDTPLEPHPEWRDNYSHAKLLQEKLFFSYQQRNRFQLVVLRPGVIYGPQGGHFSDRVGLKIGGWQFHVGGGNLLPLTYVQNCAEAVVVAGVHKNSAGKVFNVHDGDLPSSRQYLSAYKEQVTNIRSISVPYLAVQMFSSLLAQYRHFSKGQLPAVLTPYKVANIWARNRFDNSRLRSVGWKQLVPTSEALRITFAAFRAELHLASVKPQAKTA
jgi:nucleoside-diphosphate-sugar epimerase